MFGEHSANDVFIDLHAKDSGNQQGNLRTAIPRVPSFCFDNGTDDLFGWTFGPGFRFFSEENSRRYFFLTSTWWNRNSDEGFRITAFLAMRTGFIKSVPAGFGLMDAAWELFAGNGLGSGADV
jgi:hypothetical protein